jgi:hypothetical protein
MKNTFFLLVLCLLLFTLSCSSGSSTGGANLAQYNLVNVDYKIEASGVTCYNPSKFNDFSSGSYVKRNCTWFCGNYKGQSRIYVSLDFAKNSSGWSVDHEFISNGICN